MSETCDCCVGVHVATPRPIVNWPGLLRLRYRMGTHGSFLASMVARLSSRDHPSLAGLNARDPDDASTALLDGWATIADILTFYQEQIANEGYLRTATERRSILELGRLVGWVLRPGISATAFLSFTVDPDPLDPAKDPDKDRRVTIPEGTQAQNVPDPGHSRRLRWPPWPCRRPSRRTRISRPVPSGAGSSRVVDDPLDPVDGSRHARGPRSPGHPHEAEAGWSARPRVFESGTARGSNCCRHDRH